MTTPRDLAFFKQLFSTNYSAQNYELHAFAESFIDDVRAVFRVAFADGSSWVLRAYKSDIPMADWLVGCGAALPKQWLEARAATLAYLAQAGYPAPRVVPTRAGTLVGELGDWCALATTFIEGDVVSATPHTLRGMGAALGRLHRVDVASDATVGTSWWYPQLAIPAALEQYAVVAQDCPAAWRQTVADFRATLRTIGEQTLPLTLIHADAWVGNAIQTRADEIVLIDWESSGLGYAILDLGRLLLYGHMELAAQPIVPAAWRVHAFVDGYCTQRVPTPDERAVLLDAIRFNIAFGAATHFLAAHRAGWPDPQPERFTRRQHWYRVSAEIAELAQQRFDQIV